MTLPGLALFYGGLVRTKNVLSVLMQCFSIASLVTVLWVAVGYSLAFTSAADPAVNGFVGGLGKAFFANVPRDALTGSIPETVFAMFQLTFAIITPALIIGAFAEATSPTTRSADTISGDARSPSPPRDAHQRFRTGAGPEGPPVLGGGRMRDRALTCRKGAETQTPRTAARANAARVTVLAAGLPRAVVTHSAKRLTY